MPSAGDVLAVVDTNVLLSGLFWRGRPHALMEQIRAGALALICSPALLAELAEVLNRPKFQVILALSETDPEQTLGELRRLAEILDRCRCQLRSAAILGRRGAGPRDRIASRPDHHRRCRPAHPLQPCGHPDHRSGRSRRTPRRTSLISAPTT
jgi:putative PIN family toxin of toxin-antitoxin system